MVEFPLCKINLGLHVVERRPDGYHNIETCFYPVPWTDILEAIPADKFSFTSSGIPIPNPHVPNLCEQAFELLKAEYGIPAVSLHLHKILPAGAGLGGGSSDAASTLMLIDKIFNLKLGHEKLQRLSSRLGSDCPFFINPTPMFGLERGDKLIPASVSLKGKFVTIVYPNLAVDTKTAYQLIVPRARSKSLQAVVSLPHSAWRENLINDFEGPVFSKFPDLREIKAGLYKAGAWYASMSGSGSAIYGLSDQPIQAEQQFAGMRVWCGELSQ